MRGEFRPHFVWLSAMQPTGEAIEAQGQNNLSGAVHTQTAMVWCESRVQAASSLVADGKFNPI